MSKIQYINGFLGQKCINKKCRLCIKNYMNLTSSNYFKNKVSAKKGKFTNLIFTLTLIQNFSKKKYFLCKNKNKYVRKLIILK